MLVSIFAFAAVALVSETSAQFNINPPYTVSPGQVMTNVSSQWCLGQQNTCRSLCNQNTEHNLCDVTQLTYNCTCASGSSPGNISSYQQSLPAQECLVWQANCVAAYAGDAEHQADCQNVICGNKTISDAAVTTSSASMSSATASSTDGSDASGSSTASASATSATKSSAAFALSVGQTYGSGALVAAMLAVFGLAI